MMQQLTAEQWLKQGLDGTFTEIDGNWNYVTRKVKPGFVPDYGQGVHVRRLAASEESQVCGKRMVKKAPGGRKKKSFTPKQVEAVRYAKASGATLDDIAKRFATTRGQISRVLKGGA